MYTARNNWICTKQYAHKTCRTNIEASLHDKTWLISGIIASEHYRYCYYMFFLIEHTSLSFFFILRLFLSLSSFLPFLFGRKFDPAIFHFLPKIWPNHGRTGQTASDGLVTFRPYSLTRKVEVSPS